MIRMCHNVSESLYQVYPSMDVFCYEMSFVPLVYFHQYLNVGNLNLKRTTNIMYGHSISYL